MGCDCGRASTKDIKVKRIKNNSNYSQNNHLDSSTYSSNNNGASQNNKNSHHNLKDYMYSQINQFTLQLDIYFKNQRPPKNKNEPFIDDLFPPNDNSIFGLDSEGHYKDPIESTLQCIRGKSRGWGFNTGRGRGLLFSLSYFSNRRISSNDLPNIQN